jgi:glycosyltransferase involved in cell wall biosynthesis
MKVLHLCTYDYAGGAARGMYRWHASLRKLGVESKILCLNKSAQDDDVSVVVPEWQDQTIFERGILQQYFIEANRTDYSDTYFSHPLGYTSIADHALVRFADIIHVHWTSLFFDWRELTQLKALGKTIILTPHDLWPVTGGCHYPGECRGYLRECRDCPMLAQDPFLFISESRALKQRVVAEAADVVLSPSHWMDRCFAGIEAVKGVPRVVIPYCLDIMRFRGEPKESAKNELNFDPSRRLALFCADNILERRKGIESLMDVLRACEDRSELRAVIEKEAEFGLIGKGSDNVHLSTNFRVQGRGYVQTTPDLCRYYSAADLLIYLGSEDNLPNVILEAMACGTPALAFDTGGAADMVAEGETGTLVNGGDTVRFAEMLAVLLKEPEKLAWMGAKSREKITRQFSEASVGLELTKLYQAIVRRPVKRTVGKAESREETAFAEAAELAIRAAIAKGYRSLQQENLSLRSHLSERDEEVRKLRSYLSQMEADLRALSEKYNKETLRLRARIDDLRISLQRERQKTLWERVKERVRSLPQKKSNEK